MVNWAVNSARTWLAFAEGLDSIIYTFKHNLCSWDSLPFLHSLPQKISETCLSGIFQHAAHHKTFSQKNKKPMKLQEKVCNSHTIVYSLDAQISCFRTVLWRGKSPTDKRKLGSLSISVPFLLPVFCPLSHPQHLLPNSTSQLQ